VQHGNTSHEVKAEELDRFGNWVLMSVCELDGAMTAVFEDFENERGSILFVTEDGVTREFSKSLEPTTEQGYTWYRGHPKPDVLPGMPDILRDELLAGGGDPDPEQVRACFPPIRRSSADGLEKLHTFTGTAISNDVIPHYYIDVPMVSRVPTEVVAPETARDPLGGAGGWMVAHHQNRLPDRRAGVLGGHRPCDTGRCHTSPPADVVPVHKAAGRPGTRSPLRGFVYCPTR
jgi:hypothetical protein